MSRLKFAATIILLSVTLLAGPLLAQNATPPTVAANLFDTKAKPLDINAVPILTSFVKGGAKLYYLGERSGLYGWFIIKDGQVQMIYVTADGKTAMIGGMLTADGDNVTSAQVTTLAGTNKDVADLINGTNKQQQDITSAGSSANGIAAVPGDPAAVAAEAKASNLPPAVTLSPGEQLMQDMQAAAGVTVGKNENAEILMLIDPNCPYCQATWKELRDSVAKNIVQIKLVPMGSFGSNEERAAAQLLHVANPYEAWDKYVGGDHTTLDGTPNNVQLLAVRNNRALVDRWNIRATPYLVYRAKDGRVKIVQGKPDRMAAVLNDILK